jgi:hypothetical protein
MEEQEEVLPFPYMANNKVLFIVNHNLKNCVCVLSSLIILVNLPLKNVAFQRNNEKKNFLNCCSRPTHCPHEGKKKSFFQVAVIRWCYVYDPWRNIKEGGRGGGDTNTDS